MFSAKKRGKCAFSAAFETDQKNFKTVKKKYLTPSIISCMITKVIAVEKILEQTLLYDFYGELLTEHQQKIYEDVVFNDISCSEVAENQGISRQGVHDLIKRCEHILDDYETKLHLVERFVSLKEKVEAIRMAADDPEEVRKISDELLKEL